jgi:hypothetical protein
MTFDALRTGVVFFRVDSGDTMSLACRIREIGVTAQAQSPTTVYVQFLRLLRMVHRRAVTIFTRDYSVKFFGTNLDNGSMACAAIFMHSLTARNSVFSRLILPLHDIGFTVVRIHEAPFSGFKVVRYIEEAKYQ